MPHALDLTTLPATNRVIALSNPKERCQQQKLPSHKCRPGQDCEWNAASLTRRSERTSHRGRRPLASIYPESISPSLCPRKCNQVPPCRRRLPRQSRSSCVPTHTFHLFPAFQWESYSRCTVAILYVIHV